MRDAVYDRLDAQLDEQFTAVLKSDSTAQLAPNLTAWLQGTGAHREQGDLSGNIGGTFFGIDSRITDTVTLGILGGYTRSELDAPYSSATSDNFTIGTYAGALLGPWALKAGAAYTFNEIDTSRTVNFQRLQ